MALDGVYLSFLKNEINAALEGGRVDKITQPERDELDFTFRLRRGSARLLVSTSPNNPRVHLTGRHKENPLTPPMLCMLLRKHLTGARFAGAEQPGLERILFLHFDCRNELGDEVRRTLAVEIMGRHSNCILFDENRRILDAVKHIDETLSSKRQILPGLSYELPPAQDKLDIRTAADDVILARLRAENGREFHKRILSVLQGLSPIVCRELCELALRDANAAVPITQEQEQRLAFFLGRLRTGILQGKGEPVLVADAKTGKPLDFSFLNITQYGAAAAVKEYGGFSELLDAFYTERDRVERVNQRSHDMLGVIENAVERISRKIDNQRAELSACEGREQLRVCGDLITANLYRLSKGVSRCELENYYEEGSPLLAVQMDPLLTPSQNAQKYYREYRKAATAEKFLCEQIALGERELKYLDSVFDELGRSTGESELAEIREELVSEGYLKNRGGRGAQKRRENAPLTFCSSDGFTVFVGRNNRQNDRLTLKTAAKDDLWLHTRNIPGAHVIVRAEKRPVPEKTLWEAAVLAASNSKARESAQVPVDYTFVKNVKKPNGAKPGMVIYESFKTLFVTPDSSLAEKLKR